ncbi:MULTISPECIES: double-strand break repair helicase AddA [unclassified Aureimonas]|uniref:double-strand break repair helicase AddA n=1 Tax=unclassified Aureimonas TaxID=2615206 RepID=UPI0009EC1B6D|nr:MULTISPECIES: double-strand break repair helicase AddA [unclassified Aureimonas]
MSRPPPSPATIKAQSDASHPGTSVFVAANAGSGKTHVLSLRVVRLLLAGASPSKILCLTYTKAASAEMATRVFTTLSGWATAPEAALSKTLHELLGRQPKPADIARARRLFAEALESPGGLKIQTIHAFCEAILHQFPLEANVPGHFAVLDDAESAVLLAEARRLLVTGAPEASDGRAVAGAFAEALSFGGEWGLDQLLAEIVRKRDPIRAHVESSGGLEPAIRRLAQALGLQGEEDEAAIAARIRPTPGFDEVFRARLAQLAAASKAKTDIKLAETLGLIAQAATPAETLALYRGLALTQKGEPRKSVATKAVVDALPDFAERLAALQDHLAAIDEALRGLRLFRATRAALIVADRLEQDYSRLKLRRGRLDFEDLIVKTADLLQRSEAGAWVHYKLDQGIDHVLIDEAQDTSPRQWQVMRQIVEEFFAGASARPAPRTLFAVGDEKQSIYSFQGASPQMFAAERRSLAARAKEADLPFAEVRLRQSFRTVETVLEAVDRVFADPTNREGLSSEGEPPAHESARPGETGLVEIWPAVTAARVEEPDDWLRPVDVEPAASPANRLARRIAATIKDWIGDPIVTKTGRRALGAGDVLVLVRKRSGFVEAMGKALRDLRIPVAGADRLVITDHIAIQDLMALGRVVANSEDELSLAAVLKSPLFGFSDDELMALALSRGEGAREGAEALYLALRRLAGPRGPERLPGFVTESAAADLLAKAHAAFERLETLRDRAGFESVFAFYARILGPEGGRAKLTARLGRDAGEVIDAFLDLALAEEEEGQPGLDAFLADLSASPPQLRREMEHGKGEVRILTVHASKGLEAPVVFLVDPGSAPFSHAHGARLLAYEDMPGLAPGEPPGFLWRAEKDLETATVATLKAAEKRRAEEEYRRLLYVGMTRAADRLVVCGTAGVTGPHESSWLSRVEAALEPVATRLEDEAGQLTGYRIGSRDAGKLAPAAGEAAPRRRAIDLSPLPPEALPPRPLAPSGAGSNDALEIESETGAGSGPGAGQGGYVSPVLSGAGGPSQAIRRGLVVHRLLQALPDLGEGEREAAARRYLASDAASDLGEAARETLLASVLGVLADPAFAAIFAPGGRAEVSIQGTLELGGRAYRVAGTIDRLAETADEVLLVDFKTNRPPPAGLSDVPAAYVLQLALYRELLKPLYPGRPVRAALLFTEAPRLIELPAAAMDEALAARARSGASHARAADSVEGEGEGERSAALGAQTVADPRTPRSQDRDLA